MNIKDLANETSAAPLASVTVHLHPRDDVVVAKTPLPAGAVLTREGQGELRVQQDIPSGHKLALHSVGAGQALHRYGQIIGFASQDIAAGDHVHTHNLSADYFERSYTLGADVRPVPIVPHPQRRTFMGYRRPGGRAGTRNYIAVISSVNCSAHATKEIAHYFTPERLERFPNVDGVIPFLHDGGCSVRIGGPDFRILQRTLAGIALHPNVGGYLFVGLGCEANQIPELVRAYDLDGETIPPHPMGLLIQDHGGIRKTVQAGVAAIEELLPVVNAARRETLPISELLVSLTCGGSDGWSGITANPLIGQVADEIVRQGGGVLLGETTEVYGAEQLLLRRAISQEVGDKLLAQIRWWERYAERMEFEIDNNPTPGNKAGGLTTIYEKSLGAIAKGGTTPLRAVYDYAERVTERGLCFMDTPGNDWVGITGQVAGGCNLAVFSTGRGSVLGFKPTPVIKVCSNTNTYQHMIDDMDVNAGRILEGEPIEVAAGELLELLVRVASGEPSKSEAQGVGEIEFSPWSQGGLL